MKDIDMTRILAALAAMLLTCAPAAAQNIAKLPNATALTGTEGITGAQGSGCLSLTTPCTAVKITPAQIGTYLGSTFQAKDGDLDSLAAASGTNTIYYRSAANTWSPVAIGGGLSFSGGTLAASGGAGTGTSFAFTNGAGITGTVTNPSSTPTLALTLGAITPSSVAATGVVSGSNLSGTNTGDQTSVSGNAGTATKLATARTIAITGDLAWTSPSFDGSGNVTAAGTLATSGVTAGNYTNANITVDAKGRVTAAANGSAGGGSGTVTSVSVTTANGVSGSVANASTTPAISLTLGAITPSSVAATGAVSGSNLSGTNTGDQTSVTGNAGTATKWATARTLSFTGDATGTGSVDGSANVATALTLATSGVTAGTYGSATAVPVPTIDAKGRVTSITTAALGTAAAQTYAEGTFTPAIAFGGTAYTDYASRTGRYTRVGRLVTVEIAMQINVKGSATGNGTITGLPFAANTAATTGATYIVASGLTISGSAVSTISSGASVATLAISLNGALSSFTDANIANYAVLYLTFSYTV